MSIISLKHEIVQQYEIVSTERKPKEFDLAVVMGRFEPYHVGHQILVNKALLIADRVLVLIGSANAPRTIKNPFTYDERATMIAMSLTQEEMGTLHDSRFLTEALVDNMYSDDDWAKQVQEKISYWTPKYDASTPVEKRKPIKIAIVGNKKDESSYYLDLFPQYDYVPVDEVKLGFDATSIREIIFEKPGFIDLLKSLVPSYTFDFLKDFIKSPEYYRLSREYQMVKKYKEAWSVAPYAPTFVTVDAVVKKAGHVLLVKRKAAPGEGLWALPGGFVEQNERLRDAALRELKEETSIDLPSGLLLGSMGEGVVFDHPNRSLRGRTFTHAFLFDLDRADKKAGIPKTKAGDDAADAKFFTYDETLKMADKVYEDHLPIIRKLVGI
jgi:bifunctional NMN adenylyltransferase/nudix hydrolase